MYIEYNDIRSRISDPPSWWLHGIPRYDPFHPADVDIYGNEVALVHTECQSCRTRYDVAVKPRPYGGDLRSSIAWANDLDVGDPPNACPDKDRCGGESMNSEQIAVLQFWQRYDILAGWRREPSWERALVDGPWDTVGKMSGQVRIKAAGRDEEWFKARREGDFEAMTAILVEVGCERPREVANMLDLDRRKQAFDMESYALHCERVGRK